MKYSALREFMDHYEKSLGFFHTGIKNQMLTEQNIDEKVPEVTRKLFDLLKGLLFGSG